MSDPAPTFKGVEVHNKRLPPPSTSLYRVAEVPYKPYSRLVNRKRYPANLRGHSMCCNDTDIFVYGGHTSASLWCFNKRSHKWRTIDGPFMPSGMGSSSMCMWGDRVIIYGACQYPFACSNRVLIVNPYNYPQASGQELLTTGTAPLEQFGQAIAMRDDQLYVVSGAQNRLGATAEVHRLDLRTQQWTWLTRGNNAWPVPTGRFSDIVLVGDNIFLLGGRMLEQKFPLNAVWSYNLADGSWRMEDTLPDESGVATAPWPLPRLAFSCVHQVTGDGDVEAIIAGGFNDHLNQFYMDIWSLNLSTMRWRQWQHARLPHPLHSHAAATDGSGLIYFFGGMSFKADEPQRDNELFRVWTRMPTLAQMCWEAMSTFYPPVVVRSVGALRTAGVPPGFVAP